MNAKENLNLILNNIKEACLKFGRNPQSVQLLAVSKLQPIEKIISLQSAGQSHFGENYVQELIKKMDALAAQNIQWHLIGHLQKNKIKYIVGRCRLIHSIDSFELAQQLNKHAQNKNVKENILLEVNLSSETTKTGFTKDLLFQHWPALCQLSNLNICGLMTMPPLENENPEANRPLFRELRILKDKLKETAKNHPLNELSMGTSHDYKVALEEGATIIRIGTALFGERTQKV